jgi:hypothetical protein
LLAGSASGRGGVLGQTERDPGEVSTQARDVQPYGRDPWFDHGGERDVVVADHGEIFRHAQAGPQRGADERDGDVVVVCHDRGRAALSSGPDGAGGGFRFASETEPASTRATPASVAA